jgi:tRNA pseudouridine38-40 synthase
MVGALKLVGEGKWSKYDLQLALEAKDRTKCGALAPASGLYLAKVEY